MCELERPEGKLTTLHYGVAGVQIGANVSKSGKDGFLFGEIFSNQIERGKGGECGLKSRRPEGVKRWDKSSLAELLRLLAAWAQRSRNVLDLSEWVISIAAVRNLLSHASRLFLEVHGIHHVRYIVYM